MVKSIVPGLYKIRIPLDTQAHNLVNTYLIKGKDRDLLIDCGFDREICAASMCEALESLNIDLGKTDILLTHSHADHAGLLPKFVREKTRIFIGNRAKQGIDSLLAGQPRSDVADWTQWGLDKEKLKDFKACRELGFEVMKSMNFCYLHDGDNFSVGSFNFQVYETPGHCEDSCCLYDASRRMIISGDMVLDGVCPSIFSGSMNSHALADYLTSIRWLSTLEVDIVCPGHREVVDFKSRISELQEHHKQRLQSVKMALSNQPQSALEIAPRVKWYYANGKWDSFPCERKLSAIGETFSHLEYLYTKRRIYGECDNYGVWKFWNGDFVD